MGKIASGKFFTGDNIMIKSKSPLSHEIVNTKTKTTNYATHQTKRDGGREAVKKKKKKKKLPMQTQTCN